MAGREAQAMNGRWYFYDLATGLLSGRAVSGEARMLAANTPPGQGAVEVGVGMRLDPLNRRVNLATGEIEAYQPAPPADDELRRWAWDAVGERWLSTPTAAALQLQRVRALADAIAEHEAAQARPLREVLLALATGAPPPLAAVQRLQDLEALIATLRDQIRT
jgi:hypothetical protein